MKMGQVILIDKTNIEGALIAKPYNEQLSKK